MPDGLVKKNFNLYKQGLKQIQTQKIEQLSQKDVTLVIPLKAYLNSFDRILQLDIYLKLFQEIQNYGFQKLDNFILEYQVSKNIVFNHIELFLEYLKPVIESSNSYYLRRRKPEFLIQPKQNRPKNFADDALASHTNHKVKSSSKRMKLEQMMNEQGITDVRLLKMPI